MKKVLSIVLALAMVLCMIPMMSADITKTVTIEKQKYDITVKTALKDGSYPEIGKKDATNSLEAKYGYKGVKTVQTGKWTDDKKMSIVKVGGFTFNTLNPNVKDLTIKINGKKLDVSQNADYKPFTGDDTKWYGPFGTKSYVAFPAELTEDGYTESYLIDVTWTEGDTEYTEIARIEVKFTNTDEAGKEEKTAYITNIAIHDCDDCADPVAATAYIVGDKIYVDYENNKLPINIDFTFADENKAAFTGITYAWAVNNNADETRAEYLTPAANHDKHFEENGATVYYAKLNKSVGTFLYNGATKDIKFKLETENNLYATKKYELKCNEYVRPEDPKGIYLEKSEVTIAVGEEYVPVVKTASKNAVVAPTAIEITSGSDVLDFVKGSGKKVIGVKPGVAYIKAVYDKDYNGDKYYNTKMGDFYYVTSAQKVIVTLPGESIPTQTVDYVVTCRNLNVRKGAGTSFGKAGMAHRGDVVKVVEIKDGWAKLADGTYVCAKYITK